MIYFSSDLHFGHEKIIQYRPFSSIDEMNKTIIDNHNSRVGDSDTVIHLGDLCMGQLKESLPLLKELKGNHKILFAGNHDRCSTSYHHRKQKPEDWVDQYKEVGYQSIFENETINHKGIDITLCHFPYSGDHTEEERYLAHRPKYNGQWLFHGHVHDKWKHREKMINVGIDVWDFYPVQLDELMEIIYDNL